MGNSEVKDRENETTPNKKKGVIIGSVVTAIVLVIATLFFMKFKEISYDEAKAEFNVAMEQYNVEVVELDKRNE